MRINALSQASGMARGLNNRNFASVSEAVCCFRFKDCAVLFVVRVKLSCLLPFDPFAAGYSWILQDGSPKGWDSLDIISILALAAGFETAAAKPVAYLWLLLESQGRYHPFEEME